MRETLDFHNNCNLCFSFLSFLTLLQLFTTCSCTAVLFRSVLLKRKAPVKIYFPYYPSQHALILFSSLCSRPDRKCVSSVSRASDSRCGFWAECHSSNLASAPSIKTLSTPAHASPLPQTVSQPSWTKASTSNRWMFSGSTSSLTSSSPGRSAPTAASSCLAPLRTHTEGTEEKEKKKKKEGGKNTLSHISFHTQLGRRHMTLRPFPTSPPSWPHHHSRGMSESAPVTPHAAISWCLAVTAVTGPAVTTPAGQDQNREVRQIKLTPGAMIAGDWINQSGEASSFRSSLD